MGTTDNKEDKQTAVVCQKVISDKGESKRQQRKRSHTQRCKVGVQSVLDEQRRKGNEQTMTLI